MYHVRTQIFPHLLKLLTYKFSQYNYRMDLHIPVYFGKNPMKILIFICIFGDSRKSKKSAIWLICLHSDLLSIGQNSIQAFAKIIKP